MKMQPWAAVAMSAVGLLAFWRGDANAAQNTTVYIMCRGMQAAGVYETPNTPEIRKAMDNVGGDQTIHSLSEAYSKETGDNGVCFAAATREEAESDLQDALSHRGGRRASWSGPPKAMPETSIATNANTPHEPAKTPPDTDIKRGESYAFCRVAKGWGGAPGEERVYYTAIFRTKKWTVNNHLREREMTDFDQHVISAYDETPDHHSYCDDGASIAAAKAAKLKDRRQIMAPSGNSLPKVIETLWSPPGE